MNDEQIAQRLGVPPSQVTPAGLMEHEFPGVAACLPESLRAVFTDRIGGLLLEAARNDSGAPGDDFRYPEQVANARAMLDSPEIREPLARCRSGAGTPPTASSNTPWVPIAIGVAGILAVLAGIAWWSARRPIQSPSVPTSKATARGARA